MSEVRMTQEEFERFRKAKDQSLLETNWPRAKKLLEEGKTPLEVAYVMSREGYMGFASSRLGIRDIQRLQEFSCKATLRS